MTNALYLASDRGMGDGFGHRGGHFLLPLLCLVVVIGAIGLLVWALVRRPAPAVATATPAVAAAPAPSPTLQAEAILAERLARGEISPDDYRTLLAALREQPPSA